MHVPVIFCLESPKVGILLGKVAKLGKVPKYNVANVIGQIIKFISSHGIVFFIQRHIYYFRQWSVEGATAERSLPMSAADSMTPVLDRPWST